MSVRWEAFKYGHATEAECVHAGKSHGHLIEWNDQLLSGRSSCQSKAISALLSEGELQLAGTGRDRQEMKRGGWRRKEKAAVVYPCFQGHVNILHASQPLVLRLCSISEFLSIHFMPGG